MSIHWLIRCSAPVQDSRAFETASGLEQRDESRTTHPVRLSLVRAALARYREIPTNRKLEFPMRYLSYPRRFFASFLCLALSAFAFSSPAFASTADYDRYGAASDNPEMIYALKPFDDLIVTVTPFYKRPEQAWRSERTRHLLERQIKTPTRQGLSYRMNRQPHVKGAPVIL